MFITGMLHRKKKNVILTFYNLSVTESWGLMIPEEQHNADQINLDGEQGVKTFALSWNPTTDTINFQVKLSDKEFYTKRVILSFLDCLTRWASRQSSDVTIKAKIALQAIWKTKKFEWDDPLPKEMQLV